MYQKLYIMQIQNTPETFIQHKETMLKFGFSTITKSSFILKLVRQQETVMIKHRKVENA